MSVWGIVVCPTCREHRNGIVQQNGMWVLRECSKCCGKRKASEHIRKLLRAKRKHVSIRRG